MVYTFHFYEPGMFTHQRSPFIRQLADYPLTVTYPFKKEEHLAFFESFDAMGMVPPAYRREVFGREFLSDLLEPVRQFVKETGREVFCGEFGCNEFCPEDSSIRWYEDFVGLLNDMRIGHTAWSYVGFSAFMQDEPRQVRIPEIVRIISSR